MMRNRLAVCAFVLILTQAQGAKPAGQTAPADPGWPREYTDGIAKLVLHQPQVDGWEDFKKMTGRFALELYGASTWYNPATGAYARGSTVYGPYGGYARAAAYNPATGGYAWGRSAWGPYGTAASGGFYNPTTGTWGGGYHASNGYQSWGHSVVGRGGLSVRTASYSDSRGTVAGLQSSRGGKAIAARGSQGQGFAAQSASGDFYAGRDGNVYKRDQASGQWYKNNRGSWDTVNRPGQEAGAGQGAAAGRESIQGLDRDAAARNRGNFNTQRYESSRRSADGWGGSRPGGFGSRGGGFGRRR